ncbi:MAG: hypothetical protein M1823_005485 [Watsoniomyces obsoletus]|nr:MAG: hypothetical protein M1823_005485 [Watsoniomyces obsoletus]
MKLLFLCILGFVFSAYAGSTIEKRARLLIRRQPGNCEFKEINKQKYCIPMEGAERKDSTCYKFIEQPGDEYCMSVKLSTGPGVADEVGGPYRRAKYQVEKPIPETPPQSPAPAPVAVAVNPPAPVAPPVNPPANPPTAPPPA